MANNKTKFNPKAHLTSIKGKEYLEVKWRLVWFREEHPDWSIITEVVERGNGWALCKASILNTEGRVMATSHKAETKVGFGDYLEKAETGAIGRALALCGYGTQFDPELEEGKRIVDSPIGAEQINGHANGDLATFRQIEKINSLLNRIPELRLPEEKVAWVQQVFNIEVKDISELKNREASEIIQYILNNRAEEAEKHQEPLDA